jgi:hypothetical protein
MRPRKRIPCRRVILLVVATAAIAANTVPTGASAQAPQAQDRVFTTGTTSAGVLEFGSLFFSSIVIDARSGPSGETPSGRLSFTVTVGLPTPIVTQLEGTASCLSVAGNAAVIGFAQGAMFVRVRVIDGGGPGSGLDTFAIEPLQRPSDCSSFNSPFSETTVTEGDITVVDAPPLPTSKDQCKNGGYTSFGFKNQGECVAFIERGSKPKP